MRIILLSLLLLFFGIQPIFAQAKECADCIEWNAQRPLTWDDFKGKPRQSSPNKAITDSGMSIGFSCVEGKAEVSIRCYFHPDESWTKTTESDHLLSHEQLHFDITELFVRKLRKQLASLGTDCKRINNLIQDSYDRNYDAYKRYQERYDKETQHSINAEQQKRWEAKVKEELKTLEAFSSGN